MRGEVSRGGAACHGGYPEFKVADAGIILLAVRVAHLRWKEAQHNAQDALKAVVEMYDYFDDTLPSEIFVNSPEGPLHTEILALNT